MKKYLLLKLRKVTLKSIFKKNRNKIKLKNNNLNRKLKKKKSVN